MPSLLQLTLIRTLTGCSLSSSNEIRNLARFKENVNLPCLCGRRNVVASGCTAALQRIASFKQNAAQAVGEKFSSVAFLKISFHSAAQKTAHSIGNFWTLRTGTFRTQGRNCFSSGDYPLILECTWITFFLELYFFLENFSSALVVTFLQFVWIVVVFSPLKGFFGMAYW